MRYRRTETPTTQVGQQTRASLGSQLNISHLIQVEPEMLSSIARDIPR